MPILVPTKDVAEPQHMFITYKNADEANALMIIHTGTISFVWGSDDGEIHPEQLVSYVPYGRAPGAPQPELPIGKIQDFSNINTSQVVTASLGAFRVGPESSDEDSLVAVDFSVLEFATQNQPQFAAQNNGNAPWCLILKAKVAAKRGHLYRVPYQVTIQVEGEHGVASIPTLTPAPAGSMLDPGLLTPVGWTPF
ncbi:hypothetical protein [Streptomyces sp. NPDC053048]|uniref:hypothetical protein n=1 Tax=Streptomyces sp. NPDC053048 TaxID=3365694 RepID=UPI0037CDDD22